MYSAFKDYPGALENTVDIARRCNIEFDYNSYHFPKFETSSLQTVDELFEQKEKKVKVPRETLEEIETLKKTVKILLNENEKIRENFEIFTQEMTSRIPTPEEVASDNLQTLINELEEKIDNMQLELNILKGGLTKEDKEIYEWLVKKE